MRWADARACADPVRAAAAGGLGPGSLRRSPQPTKLLAPALNQSKCTPTLLNQAIWEIHAQDGLPLRTAAFVKALQRVTRARIHRGFD